jgi:hypothetical protein
LHAIQCSKRIVDLRLRFKVLEALSFFELGADFPTLPLATALSVSLARKAALIMRPEAFPREERNQTNPRRAIFAIFWLPWGGFHSMNQNLVHFSDSDKRRGAAVLCAAAANSSRMIETKLKFTMKYPRTLGVALMLAACSSSSWPCRAWWGQPLDHEIISLSPQVVALHLNFIAVSQLCRIAKTTTCEYIEKDGRLPYHFQAFFSASPPF